MRALAVQEHLPEEAADIGHGIKLRTPSFIPEAPVRDFTVPGKVLKSYYPSNRSALLVFYAPDAFDAGSLAEGMDQITGQYETVLQVKIHRKEMTKLADYDAASFIMEGYGTGRSISMSQGKKPEGTVQRWVVAQRNRDLIGFLLTAGSAEFDQRNAEFETWLKHVEISDQGG